MRVIVAGGRDFNNIDLLYKELNQIFSHLHHEGYLTGRIEIDNNNIEIISGKAKGADSLGECFAKDYDMKVKEFPAAWGQLGKRAGYARNEQMAKYAKEDEVLGVLIAFWDGKSKGTKHMIDLANKYGLRVFVVNY